ncbi:SirB2 family protein [Fodinicurvata fenggangensis]|uniref:SirB2 family protein n=1 Tax=Fodinicurvata fenggangensis TaxID=1121830 RepID=UPI00047C5191|nr:SirB2 family protein [Fodinicurvata fenggangensis]
MIEFYSEIRQVHIWAVLASGGLFLLRGIALFAGTRWSMVAPVRYLSYSIDTILLTAALMLMTIVRQYPFFHSWLTVKVLLLVVYILLGYYAFWKAPTRTIQVGAWTMALLVYAFIFSIARAHHPLGVFYTLAG